MEDEDAMSSDNSVPFGYGASAYGSEAEEDEEAVEIHRALALQTMEWESFTDRYIITVLPTRFRGGNLLKLKYSPGDVIHL